ncbi:MAG: hypothetical protein P4L39_03730 [Humidesulfovibrio sp.]|nr:hypothetical protein [Humidesulfovibrio sp.]
MVLHEATTNQREAVAEARAAPTLWGAYREAGLTCTFVMLAGYALTQSLKADRERVVNFGVALRAQAKGKIFGRITLLAPHWNVLPHLVAEGWITALAKEAERGGAFLEAAKLLDETHADEMLAKSKRRKYDSANFGQL